MELEDIWVALRTLFSAGTYLFSLGTTIYAMVDFSREYIKYRHLCHNSCSNFSCRNRSYDCLRAHDAEFILVLSSNYLFFAHTVNALMFVFKFDKAEAPLKSAYFLPFMQLWRLLNLVKQTWSCKGFKDFQLEAKNTLFTQLSLSLEPFPMYTIQLISWCYKLKYYLDSHIMYAGVMALPISTASSFLASFCLGGFTVQATAKNVKSLKMKAAIGISSGLAISAAAYIRVSSLTTLYYLHGAKQRIAIYQGKESSNIYKHETKNALLLAIKTTAYIVIFFCLTKKKESPMYTRIFKAFALAYTSVWVGPLYPLVSEALEHDQLGTLPFRIKLFVIASGNLFLDCLIIPHVLQFISHGNFIVPAVLYFISVGVYIIVDSSCGKMDPLPAQTSQPQPEAYEIGSSFWAWESALAILWIPFPIPIYGCLYPLSSPQFKV